MSKHQLYIAILFCCGLSQSSFGQSIAKHMKPDTADLLSHRWLVTATETAGKKTTQGAGSMPLYMNFFSNGGFDFVAIGDGDFMIWKYRNGSVGIYHKTEPAGKPEVDFRIEKLKGGSMVMSGVQNGTLIRYSLTHQPGD